MTLIFSFFNVINVLHISTINWKKYFNKLCSVTEKKEDILRKSPSHIWILIHPHFRITNSFLCCIIWLIKTLHPSSNYFRKSLLCYIGTDIGLTTRTHDAVQIERVALYKRDENKNKKKNKREDSFIRVNTMRWDHHIWGSRSNPDRNIALLSHSIYLTYTVLRMNDPRGVGVAGCGIGWDMQDGNRLATSIINHRQLSLSVFYLYFGWMVGARDRWKTCGFLGGQRGWYAASWKHLVYALISL